MAETLLLPVLRGVIGKAADGLVQSITRMWGVDDDREKLERHLLYVSCKLADAEVKGETDPAVRAWMKALKAVAYKADDVLDDFQYEALRREAQGNQSTASKVLSKFTSKNRLVFRYKTSRDLKDVLDKIDELVTEMNKFGLVERAEPPQIPYRQTHSAIDDSAEIFGRDKDKEAVVKLLLNHQDQQNVQVLSITGMGGLGKTTLAKMVYNDTRVQKHFVLKMWHCVSENFEAIPLVRSVIELATKDRCELPDSVELLRVKLQEVIGRKRFLLVLDDVWNEEEHKWEDDLKPLLCSLGGSGSMIVVTSRSRGVASIMGTFPHYELVCLSEDDSWELFSKKAFSKGVKEQPELVVIGKRIVNKCKGLPLALKTMGGLMSSKQRVQEWEAIADCNISDTDRGKDEVMPILKLSYRHLSSEMKQCFAFCAVFPKDYEMEKDMLIQLWMANGYIHEEGIMNLVQKAEFVFNELAWRSFLQDDIIMMRYYWLDSKIGLYGCKMHDLMHDLAKEVANECATVEELIQRKVSINDVFHLQISENDQEREITPLFSGTINLRTLLTPSSLEKDLVKAKLMSSRALRFNCRASCIVHRQLIQTPHLRYLDLSGSSIVSLPDTVCILYNLLSLRLNRCYLLQKLPEGMSCMRKLNHIYLLRCYGLKRMPPKLSQLHNLVTLTTFVVDTEDGRGIEELEDLRQLGNRLELYNLQKVKCGSKANLPEKQNLNELFLCWGLPSGGYYKSTIDEAATQEQVLESLVPHDQLKFLGVYGYGGCRVSHWMRKSEMFRCLRELVMNGCQRCEDLPTIWFLPSLESLSLSLMESLTTLCKNVDVEAKSCNTSLQIFPKLKVMQLYKLNGLERWAENSAGEMNSLVLFPELKVLTIINCNKLTTLPESPVLAHLCVSYDGGEAPYLIRGCDRSMVDTVMPLDGQQRHLDTLRQLDLGGDGIFVSIFNETKLRLGLGDRLAFVETLEISSCSNIVRWPLEELRCLPRLLSLRLSSLEKLVGMSSSIEEEKILPLPLLENLSIHGCASLLEIPQLPASLEKVQISDCKSLVALPSNLGNLPKLRNLDISSCLGLKALSDGMDGLPSLERLTIDDCEGIEEFPQGLLQRLPSLKYLDIRDCPGLQRRCREGGEYFDLVSSIPHKRISSPAAESSVKKFIKKLASPCGI